MYERKRLLPLRDAIVLHLEPLSSRANPYTMPDSTCQEAMSDRLSASRGNLSRVMNELKNEGYLEETRAHVPIGKLRRKTYVLTEVGMKEARDLRISTGDTAVNLKDENGELFSVKLRDIPRDIRDGSTLLDVALNVHRGVFDKRAYIDQLRKKSRFISKEDQRPKIWHFFGREKELSKISEWYDSKTQTILELRGVAGIGKTALASKAFMQLKDRTNTLWLTITDQSTIESVLDDMAAFLKLMGKKRLDSHLKYHRKRPEKDAFTATGDEKESGELKPEEVTRMNEVQYVLRGDLGSSEVLMVFDGCEKASDRMGEFMGRLAENVTDRPKVKIILAGRTTSHIPRLKNLRESGRSTVVSLKKLDFDSSKSIMAVKGVETWRLEEAYAQTGGLPFFLDLMGPSYESRATDIEGYLVEEVLSQLSSDEIRILRIASIFNEPVHSDAFFQWKRTKFGSIRALVEKSLLFEVAPMVYETHDILRDLIGKELKGRTRKVYHKRAAAHFVEQGAVDDILQGASHLIAAGEIEEGASLLAKEGRKMISKGLARDLYELLQAVETLKNHPSEPELAFLRGECLYYRGQWDEAIVEYDQSILFSEAAEDFGGTSVPLRRTGQILMWKGLFEDALEPLQRSAEMAEKSNDLVELAECHYSLAGLMRKTGDITAYKSYVDLCKRFAQASGDKLAIAKAHKADSILKSIMGKDKIAYQIAERALDYAKQAEDPVLLSDCYGILAHRLYDLKKREEALKLDIKSIDIAREIGEARSIAFRLSNTASTYIAMERHSEAREFVEEAEEIFEDIGERRMLAQIYQQYGYIYADESWTKAKKYLGKSLNAIDEFGSPIERCEFYTIAGHLYLWCRDKKGLGILKKASALASEVDDKSLRKVLEAGIETALEDRKRLR